MISQAGLIGLFQPPMHRERISSVFMAADSETSSLFAFILFPGAYTDVFEVATMQRYQNIFLVPVSLQEPYLSDVYRLASDLRNYKAPNRIHIVYPDKFPIPVPFAVEDMMMTNKRQNLKGCSRQYVYTYGEGFIAFNWGIEGYENPVYSPDYYDIYVNFAGRRYLFCPFEVNEKRVTDLLEHKLVDYVYMPYSYTTYSEENFLSMISKHPEFKGAFIPFGFRNSTEAKLCWRKYRDNFPVTKRWIFIRSEFTISDEIDYVRVSDRPWSPHYYPEHEYPYPIERDPTVPDPPKPWAPSEFDPAYIPPNRDPEKYVVVRKPLVGEMRIKTRAVGLPFDVWFEVKGRRYCKETGELLTDIPVPVKDIVVSYYTPAPGAHGDRVEHIIGAQSIRIPTLVEVEETEDEACCDTCKELEAKVAALEQDVELLKNPPTEDEDTEEPEVTEEKTTEEEGPMLTEFTADLSATALTKYDKDYCWTFETYVMYYDLIEGAGEEPENPTPGGDEKPEGPPEDNDVPDNTIIIEGADKVFNTLKDAVDYAPVFSRIILGDGAYDSELLIDKPITIMGAKFDAFLTGKITYKLRESFDDDINRRKMSRTAFEDEYGLCISNVRLSENAIVVAEPRDDCVTHLTIKNCTFETECVGSSKYFTVQTKPGGKYKLNISNNDFLDQSSGAYNLLELWGKIVDGSTISDNRFFVECCTHNMINIYGADEGATIYIERNQGVYTSLSVRVTLFGNPTATIEMNDNSYDEPVSMYAGLLMQAVKDQSDYSGTTIKYNNHSVPENEALDQGLGWVYSVNKEGYPKWTDKNMPKVFIDGEPVDIIMDNEYVGYWYRKEYYDTLEGDDNDEELPTEPAEEDSGAGGDSASNGSEDSETVGESQPVVDGLGVEALNE